MEFLNSKERKRFFAELNETYGYNGSTDYALYYGGKDRIYVVSRDIEKIPFEHMRIRQGGLYIASTMGAGIRLTLDGAQLFGPACTNITEISEYERNQWMMGADVPIGESDHKLTILSHDETIIGCGPVKDGVVLNYLPKSRRVQEVH